MLLADTFLFNAGTKTWKQVSGGVVPPARASRRCGLRAWSRSRHVWRLRGNPCCTTTLNDMYVWNGSAWAPVAST